MGFGGYGRGGGDSWGFQSRLSSFASIGSGRRPRKQRVLAEEVAEFW